MPPIDWAGVFFKFLAVAILVVLNGFFVAAEFALVKVRETQLTALITKGHRRAKIAQRIIRNLDATLSACQVGITMASLGLGWIGEPVFGELLGPVLSAAGIVSEEWRHSISFVVGFSAITFLHIVAGEQAPKWMAIQKPLHTSLWVAAPLEWFHNMSYPFIWVLNSASLKLLSWMGIDPVQEGGTHVSEEELRLLIATSHSHPKSPALGRDILLNALDLRRRVVRDVMRSRQEIVGLDTESTLQECLATADRTRYSRFPILENGNPDRAVGVVHIKDLYGMRDRAGKAFDLIPAARGIIYIPAMARLEKLLKIFLEKKLHLALVVDEYGGTVGLVTLENILEELVGPIQDEFDQESTLRPEVERISDREWMISGSLPVHELSEMTGETLTMDNVTTMSGLVTSKLGDFPKLGDRVRVGNCELKVEEIDGRRVARLRLTRIEPPNQPSA